MSGPDKTVEQRQKEQESSFGKFHEMVHREDDENKRTDKSIVTKDVPEVVENQVRKAGIFFNVFIDVFKERDLRNSTGISGHRVDTAKDLGEQSVLCVAYGAAGRKRSR